MYNRHITGTINLVVAEPGSHRRRPSSNPKELFYLSFCHKVGDSKATGVGESIKLFAGGIGWNWENEGNVRTLE